MKKLLFMLAVLPVTSFAQNWILSASAGMGVNTVADIGVIKIGKAMITPALGIAISHKAKRLEVGLKAGYVSLGVTLKEIQSTNGIDPTKTVKYKYYYAQNGVSITPFFNYDLIAASNRFYIGANAGIVATFEGKNDNNIAVSLDKVVLAYKGGIGVVGGLQIGYARQVSKHFVLGAEISPNYFSGSFKMGSSAEKFKISVGYFTAQIKAAITL